MADQETWAKRVAEWKASGLTSPAFCEGKDFSPGGLRHMAHRLGVGRRQRRPRIAKVVCLESARPAERPQIAPSIVVELGAARVLVPPGADRATVATVVEVLTAAASARRAR